MVSQRPDLTQAAPAIRAYIEALEAEIAELRAVQPQKTTKSPAPDLEPSEPPTTTSIITVSQRGFIKRTPRHLYQRQRRGGMGVFDLDTGEDDPPGWLAIADEAQSLLIITDHARAFLLPLQVLPEIPVRGQGQPLTDYLVFDDDEYPVIVIANQGEGYFALVTAKAHVRRFRAHYFGEAMKQGLALYDVADFGPPAAACWTPGDADIFIATGQGCAIRFAEAQVPVRGCQGIRLEQGDEIVGLTAVRPESSVFLLSTEGKGTLRLMSGFSANKAPGAGGKVAMKTATLVASRTVETDDDLFIISRLGKLIRFQASEVPTTGGVVQGVHCMALRADESVAVISSS